MRQRRSRRTSRWELVFGLLLSLALVVSGGVLTRWTHDPALGPYVPWPESDGGAQVGVAGSATGGGPAFAATSGAVQPDRSEGSFRTVCCRRADQSTYWTTADWCDDVGAAVDGRLCEKSARGLERPEEVPPARPASEAAAPAVSDPEDDCDRRTGKRRSGELCPNQLESVCCRQDTRVATVSRWDCLSVRGQRVVEAALCEPVCCYQQATRSIGWSVRGNCASERDPAAVVVSEQKCDEVCCETRDHKIARSTRRVCAERGGTARSPFACGTTVTAETPKYTDLANGEAHETTHVDLEITAPAQRPPPASPF